MDEYRRIIEKSVRKSGDYLVKKFNIFSRDKIKMKSAHEIVTEYDLASEKIILKTIRNNFPDHAILSEEYGANNKKSDWLWVIDPIDGTTNFSMHNPLWCISVGLLYKKEVVLGCIYVPFLKEFFYAEKNKGAFLNNKKITVSKIKTGKILNTFCHGSKDSDIKKAIKYYSSQKLNNFDCRQLGSAAIELAYVACGRLESIVIPGANSWDVAAGVLMVKEAGGMVTDFNKKKWNLDSKDMVASNKLVYSNVLKVINKL